MSILIHMEMPKDGECIVVSSYGTAYKYELGDVVMYGDAYNETADVIELPPHGRLIDADALEFLYEESADGWRHTPVFMDFFKACAKGVRETPTIIPADYGKDKNFCPNCGAKMGETP